MGILQIFTLLGALGDSEEGPRYISGGVAIRTLSCGTPAIARNKSQVRDGCECPSLTLFSTCHLNSG